MTTQQNDHVLVHFCGRLQFTDRCFYSSDLNFGQMLFPNFQHGSNEGNKTIRSS